MIRIWNERSQAIGGVGAVAVIRTLKSVGITAKQGDSEFKAHEGVFVAECDQYTAERVVVRKHGRID